MMKLLLVTLMLFPMLSFSTDKVDSKLHLENRLRAEKSKVESLVSELRKLKSSNLNNLNSMFDTKHRNNCDDDDINDDPVTCVPNCSVRGSSGDCLSYSSDYCGPNASCTPNCSVRGSSGDCLSYSSDLCGEGITCVPNCSVRGSSGDCLSYSSDYCGTNAYCSPNCTVRGSSGDCLSYGSDICY